METIFGLIGAAALGSVAWLYQRAWERATNRINLYQEIIGNLEGFFAGTYNAEKIDQAAFSSRKLWLEGPDEVVRSINAFFYSVENGKDDKEDRFKQLVLLMRKNSSVWHALIPAWGKSTLKAEDIIFHTATRKVVVTPASTSEA